MPSLDSMVIPPPRSWDEFEAITLSCIKIKWSSPNFTRHGRGGQEQHGVDLYGLDDLRRIVGVQCKHTTSVGMPVVLKEIEKAEGFEPQLHALYLATSAPTDSNLQREIRLESERRVQAGRFPVGIFFWEDLITELRKNRDEFRKHYPDIHLVDDPPAIRGARLLALVEAGYYGTHLLRYMQLVFGEFGQLAGEVPETYRAILNVVNSSGAVILEEPRSTQFAGYTEELWSIIEGICYRGADSDQGWASAARLARLLEAEIDAVEPRLNGMELAAFSAAAMLARWEFRNPSARKLKESDFQELVESIAVVSPRGEVPDEVSALIREYLEGGEMEGSSVPGRIYPVLRRLARIQEIRISS